MNTREANSSVAKVRQNHFGHQTILTMSSLRSQQAFMQSSLSQPSMMLSGPSLHSYPGVQAPDLGKPQSNLAYQQPSSTQHIPILFEPQLNQPSGMGGSQLIDTHLLQVTNLLTQNIWDHLRMLSVVVEVIYIIFPSDFCLLRLDRG